jgi:hypothetical protein
MITFYIIIVIYYLSGIEYSFQLYTKIDRLDDVKTLSEALIASFVIPTFWLILYAQKSYKRFKETRKTRIYNKI